MKTFHLFLVAAVSAASLLLTSTASADPFRGGWGGHHEHHSSVSVDVGFYPSYGYYRGGYSNPYYYDPYYYEPVGRPIYQGRRVYSDDSRSLEADVQRALARRGFYRGAIDGDIGPASREAIRNYQAERGLRITGRIDDRLLRSLGV